MAKLNVNIGLSVNDKTGDTLRTAFDKINLNFTELYTLTGGTSTALIELAQDYAAPMFNHASHVNITAVYDDANNKILLTGAAQVQSDWAQTTNTALDFIKNKPTLFSGSYTDLTNKPTISAGIGDFTFTNSSATVPVNTTLTLTAFDNTTKESKLTLSPTTKSSLYAANNLELGIGYGTGFEKYWLFGSDGSIRFPDNTTQTTAFTGTGNVGFRNDTIFDLAGLAINNSNQTTASTAGISIPANGSGVLSIVNNTNTWGFGSDGNITVPAGKGIQSVSGGYQSAITLNPYRILSQTIEPGTQNYSVSGNDYVSATWTDTGFGGSTIAFTTPEQYVLDFISTDLPRENNVTVRINGAGAEYLYQYSNGTNEIYLTGAPTSLTAVTEIRFSYQRISKIHIEPDDGVFDIVSRAGTTIDIDAGFDLRMTAYDDVEITAGDQLLLRSGDNYASITTNYNVPNATPQVWTFNTDGTTQLPLGGVISEGGGLTGAIKLKPAGGANDYQALLIYPTAGGDGDHIHLTAGGGTTELYLGSDNHYVKLASGGVVRIQADNGVNSSAAWTFGTNGAITTTDPLTLTVPGVPNGVANWNGQGGWNSPPYTNKATTGGTGTGLTVNVSTASGGYIDITAITINTAGTGYTNGDVITITNENNLPGTFTITVPSNNWTFGANGNTTFPTGLRLSAARGSGTVNFTSDIDKVFQIETQTDSTSKLWNFGTDGWLTLPANGVVQANTLVALSSFNDTNNIARVICQSVLNAPQVNLKTITSTGAQKDWIFSSTGALKLPLGNSVISNLVVAGDLSTGSQIQVGSGDAADTGIIISNGATSDVDGSVLQTGSVVNVNGSSASMALKTFNSLGVGGPTLTAEQLVETGGNGVRIGYRVTNDPGDGSPPVTSFTGWTFDAEELSLPKGAVINETPSSPGLYRTKYSGTFVLDPTWFVTNAGNLIETTIINGTIQLADVVETAFSFQYFGYFVPPTSANYTFRAHADETFVFWIGAKALSGYTYANKDMYGNYNGTFPEQQTQSFTIALTAGEFYPIRIQWANSSGWGELDTFTWANDSGQANTADFTGRIYTANTGTAKISANDNKSIILSTDNATDNNWTFAPNGSLTLPSVGKINNSGYDWTFGSDGKLTAPGNLQVDGGKIILNTGGNAYVESVDYGVNSANSAVNIFGGPYQKIKLRAGFGTEATWQFGTDGRTTFPNGAVPEHSYGAAGDKEGMVVFSDPYIYYCKQDYVDNVTDIWVRVAWTGTNW